MGPEPSSALERLTVTWRFSMHATSSLTPATRPPPRVSSETRTRRRVMARWRVMAHRRGKSHFFRATALSQTRQPRNSPRARSSADRTAGTHRGFPRDERTTFFAEEIPRHVERPDRGWWAPVSEGFLASRPTTMAPRKKPLVKPEDAANLRVLQREDPEVEAILGSASHVTLYGFNLEEQAWVSDPALSPLHRGRARSPGLGGTRRSLATRSLTRPDANPAPLFPPAASERLRGLALRRAT